MSRPESVVFEHLGPDGLARTLDDVLDQTRLARLATACGVSYPGIRTRSQKRERIVADLVAKAGQEDAARKAILRVLRKETAAAARSWSRVDPAEQERRLADPGYLLAERKLGLHLFLLAASPNGGDDSSLTRLTTLKELLRSSPEPRRATASDPATRKELTRLRKADTQLRKKLQHLEGQISKSREAEKRLKKDLIERKGELAESRMLVERLRREQEAARGSSRSAATTTDKASDDAIAKAVRRLTAQQRKLVHDLGKLLASPPEPRDAEVGALTSLVRSVEELRAETRAILETREGDGKEIRRRLEEIRNGLRTLRSAAAPRSSPSRRQGPADRVGVFVDVQNVYYGARQLKGKLDFDALLQAAVRDRRMIQATAYVVESQEIDQSSFIAMLQTRAIEVRRKTLRIRADGSMKGDWDMEMALDILDAAPNLDIVVLVSGDGDFTSLVKRVKSIGPTVEVVAFPRNTAKSLLEAADRFQPLDRKFMIRTAEPKPAARPAERKDKPAATKRE